MPLTQVDEGGPSGTVSSPVAETETESVHETPPSRPQGLTSSSGAAIGPSTSGSADILGLAVIPIFLVAAAEIANEEISLLPITSPYAM